MPVLATRARVYAVICYLLFVGRLHVRFPSAVLWRHCMHFACCSLAAPVLEVPTLLFSTGDARVELDGLEAPALLQCKSCQCERRTVARLGALHSVH